MINKISDYFTLGYTKGSSVYYFFVNLWRDSYKNVRKKIPRYVWRDRDVVLQDVMFQLFLDFIHIEQPDWILDENSDRLKDFQWLNNYLTKERPKLYKIMDSHKWDGDFEFESVSKLHDTFEPIHHWHDAFEIVESQDAIAEELIFKWRKSLWT
jgi:hypothetical protein